MPGFGGIRNSFQVPTFLPEHKSIKCLSFKKIAQSQKQIHNSQERIVKKSVNWPLKEKRWINYLR